MREGKQTKKVMGFWPIFVFMLISSLGVVSADLSEVLESAKQSFFGRENFITGYATSRETNVSVTISNSAPVVEYIFNATGDPTFVAQSVNEDDSADAVQIEVNFTASDVDGVADLDDSSANITLIRAATGILGEENNISTNASCTAVQDIDTETAEYNCVVQIHYWFDAGEWNITAGIADASGAADTNTTNFTISSTTAIVISPLSLTFASVNIGDANTTSNNDPIVINNTANAAPDGVDLAALDLIGEVTVTDVITANNFSADIDTGGSPPAECDAATEMVNNTATEVAGTVLAAANRSYSGLGNESVYICLRLVPSGISAQTYSTLNSTPWTVSV